MTVEWPSESIAATRHSRGTRGFDTAITPALCYRPLVTKSTEKCELEPFSFCFTLVPVSISGRNPLLQAPLEASCANVGLRSHPAMRKLQTKIELFLSLLRAEITFKSLSLEGFSMGYRK
ncbi:hypothetical protein CC2G_010127 [Coprinopsis cinerea AmutBmut pab1-1]|nr:hypothetical protein CC2G_010127 [Coprinopsis cinerea AmutBmut pab1-1]